jgi:hypothetical protein
MKGLKKTRMKGTLNHLKYETNQRNYETKKTPFVFKEHNGNNIIYIIYNELHSKN